MSFFDFGGKEMGLPQHAVSHEPLGPEDQEFDDIGKNLITELEALDLPYEDGIPMESNWHRLQMNLLIELVEQHWNDRDDFFVGGNMFIYFNLEQARTKDYRGPDFFVVKGTDGNRSRKSWIVWEERGKYPHVIVELASPSTLKTDLGIKKEIYERTFRTPEYFCYDPETNNLYGWRWTSEGYKTIPEDENGRMESQELGLLIGPWKGEHMRLDGTWLRLYTLEGYLVPKFSEAEAKRAKSEANRATAETKRADQAEAELERLKALLADKGISS